MDTQDNGFRDQVNKHMGAYEEFARTITREMADMKKAQSDLATDMKQAQDDALDEMRDMYKELYTDVGLLKTWRQSVVAKLTLIASAFGILASLAYKTFEKWLLSKTT